MKPEILFLSFFFFFFPLINLLNSALDPGLRESDPHFFSLLNTDFKNLFPYLRKLQLCLASVGIDGRELSEAKTRLPVWVTDVWWCTVGKPRFKFIPCWSQRRKSLHFSLEKLSQRGCFTKIAGGRSHFKCLLRDDAQVQRCERCGTAHSSSRETNRLWKDQRCTKEFVWYPLRRNNLLRKSRKKASSHFLLRIKEFLKRFSDDYKVLKEYWSHRKKGITHEIEIVFQSN